ncbi:hypothetical protein FOA52_012481 [Chlamydomonas sp. UWO 241]|nr:hypothetical protein FOA52_012481 [Chlamydomonas sp. UWO 241]
MATLAPHGPRAWGCAHAGRVAPKPTQPPRLGELGYPRNFEWQIGELIGKGAYGTVNAGINFDSGDEAAIKTLPKTRAGWTRETALSKIERETEVLTALKPHGGIVRLIECFEDDDNVQLVTELCRGGDLEAYTDAYGTLDEASLARVAFEVLTTVKGFHDSGYVHGDVKPGNFVLVTPSCFIAASMPAGGLKAVDVGCAQAVAPVVGRLSRRAGTPVFMAPEVFAQDFSFKADVWAAGVMLYWLFSGDYPVSAAVPDMHSAKLVDIAAAVTTCDATFDDDVWRTVSPDGRDFLAQCLARDEATRMDVDAALAHPWIRRLGAPRGSKQAARSDKQQLAFA